MKLASYILKDGPAAEKIGVLTASEQQIVDLQAASEVIRGSASEYFTDMMAFLEGGEAARNICHELLQAAGDECRHAINDIRVLAPLPRPRSLRDCACFEEHVFNCHRQAHKLRGEDIDNMDPSIFKPGENWYKKPLYYKGNVDTIVGPDAEVTYPEGEQFKDFELELAVIIGKEGKNINARDAMDHVGGYTIFNDFSARMTMLGDMGDPKANFGPGASKDFANGLGPWMVTPDAFDWQDARGVVRVNGEQRYEGNHAEIYHQLPDIIEALSANITLYPGDVIGTGTFARCCGLEHGQPLYVDDVIELEIENIGVLRNRVAASKGHKIRNRERLYKRSVCAQVDGQSTFIFKDDYPDVWRAMPGIADVWRVDEMPAKDSASGRADMGNLPLEHEAPRGGNTLRHVGMDWSQLPDLEGATPEMRAMALDYIYETHKAMGTHYLPTEEDMEKHISMHKTDSLNLFFCSESDGFIALNDGTDIRLQPGDALIQAGNMHGWKGKGTVSGLLVSADLKSLEQLAEKPQPAGKSTLNKFRRYVTGTMKSDRKAIGWSDVLIADYSPNERELHDADGKLIGYAGDIWRTFAPDADISCSSDTVGGQLEDRPPKGGITFRMMELLPGCKLETHKAHLNYYCVIKGQLTAVSETGSAVAERMQDIVQLKDAELALVNSGSAPLLMAHFMIDTHCP